MKIFTVTFLFGLVKLDHIVSHKNPFINTYTETQDNNTVYNTGEEDFVLAFAAEKFWSKLLNDKRYIKWEVILWEYNDGVLKNATYNLNPCTEEEIARFSPAESYQTKTKVEWLQKNGYLYCLDKKLIGIDLFGAWRTGDSYLSIEVTLAPCVSSGFSYDGQKRKFNESCETDQKNVQEYLGRDFNIIMS